MAEEMKLEEKHAKNCSTLKSSDGNCCDCGFENILFYNQALYDLSLKIKEIALFISVLFLFLPINVFACDGVPINYWEVLPQGEIAVANCYDDGYLYFNLHAKVADFPKSENENKPQWHEATITLETDDHTYIVLKEPRVCVRAKLKNFNSLFFQEWEYLK